MRAWASITMELEPSPNNFRKRLKPGNGGFTLIEVIAVLVIIGILAAVAAVKTTATNFNLVAEANNLKVQLRFAQLKALQDDTASWGITINTNSYTLICSDGSRPLPFLPSENSATHLFPTVVTVTSGTGTIQFDKWGSPGTTDQPITLSDGTNTVSLTIQAHTGFITS